MLPSLHHLHARSASSAAQPRVSVNEYRARRERVAAALANQLEQRGVAGGVVVIYTSAPVQRMQHDIQRVFRQDPDFLWLTGLGEPHALLAWVRTALGASRWVLLLTESSREEARWHVPRTTREAMERRFLDGRVRPLTTATLRTLLRECRTGPDAPTVCFETERGRALPPALMAALREAGVEQLRAAPWWRAVVQRERVVKSPAELELLRRSANASCAALLAVMRASVVGHRTNEQDVTEAKLAATFRYLVATAGAKRLAFPTIVAAGDNATVLHYHRADDALRPGQLLLVDAGCEMDAYCSDVARTWPVSGRFSAAQRMLYEAVLEIHRVCVEACREGAPGGSALTLESLQRVALAQARDQLTGLRRALRATGARDAVETDEVSVEETTRCFPHAVAHFVGMDTHDTPLVGHDTPIPANAVLAIEPGLYLPRAGGGGGDSDPWQQLRGLGVRVEDMVVVGAPGTPPEVLTDGVPKSVRALQTLLCSEGAARQRAR